jgi:hypothetical protein
LEDYADTEFSSASAVRRVRAQSRIEPCYYGSCQGTAHSEHAGFSSITVGGDEDRRAAVHFCSRPASSEVLAGVVHGDELGGLHVIAITIRLRSTYRSSAEVFQIRLREDQWSRWPNHLVLRRKSRLRLVPLSCNDCPSPRRSRRSRTRQYRVKWSNRECLEVCNWLCPAIVPSRGANTIYRHQRAVNWLIAMYAALSIGKKMVELG